MYALWREKEKEEVLCAVFSGMDYILHCKTFPCPPVLDCLILSDGQSPFFVAA